MRVPAVRRPLRALAAAAGLALGSAGCDGPGGPGTLRATIRSPHGPEGAAVVELRGEGITGVSGAAGTRVLSAPVPGAETGKSRLVTYRAVVVHPAGGELRFTVDVADVGAPSPGATVLEVVDPENRFRTSLSAYSVRFEASGR